MKQIKISESRIPKQVSMWALIILKFKNLTMRQSQFKNLIKNLFINLKKKKLKIPKWVMKN